MRCHRRGAPLDASERSAWPHRFVLNLGGRYQDFECPECEVRVFLAK